MKSERLCAELEEVAGKMFGQVRREEGRFQTGTCKFKGRQVLIVNSRQPIDERIAALSREIARAGVEDVYLKPALRAEVEKFTAL